MIHGNVVEGVMSQTDMDAMMYKIEGEDLYLIGTSEHSMTMGSPNFSTSTFSLSSFPMGTEGSMMLGIWSMTPCFRKEKGSHGIEERGVYRIHQFEKQEMIVVCKPEDFQEGDQHPGRGDGGVVEGVGEVVLSILALDPYLQPPGLGVAQVGD